MQWIQFLSSQPIYHFFPIADNKEQIIWFTKTKCTFHCLSVFKTTNTNWSTVSLISICSIWNNSSAMAKRIKYECDMKDLICRTWFIFVKRKKNVPYQEIHTPGFSNPIPDPYFS